MNQKMLIVLVIISIAGASAYFVLGKKLTPPKNTLELQKTPPLVNNTSSQASTSLETADWKVYRNDKYGIEFRYPIELSESVDINELETKYAFQSILYFS